MPQMAVAVLVACLAAIALRQEDRPHSAHKPSLRLFISDNNHPSSHTILLQTLRNALQCCRLTDLIDFWNKHSTKLKTPTYVHCARDRVGLLSWVLCATRSALCEWSGTLTLLAHQILARVMSPSFAGRWSGTVRHLLRRYRLYNFLIAGYVRALSPPNAWVSPRATREVYAVMAVMHEAVRANVEAAAGRLPVETETGGEVTNGRDYRGPASVCNPVVFLLDGLFHLAQDAHEASLALHKPARLSVNGLCEERPGSLLQTTLPSLRSRGVSATPGRSRSFRRSHFQLCDTPAHHKLHSCLAIWALNVHSIQTILTEAVDWILASSWEHEYQRNMALEMLLDAIIIEWCGLSRVMTLMRQAMMAVICPNAMSFKRSMVSCMGTCLRKLCHFGYQILRFQASDKESLIRRNIFMRQIDRASAFYFFKDTLSKSCRAPSDAILYAEEELRHCDYIEGMLIISEVYKIHIWFVLLLKTHKMLGPDANLSSLRLHHAVMACDSNLHVWRLVRLCLTRFATAFGYGGLPLSSNVLIGSILRRGRLRPRELVLGDLVGLQLCRAFLENGLLASFKRFRDGSYKLGRTSMDCLLRIPAVRGMCRLYEGCRSETSSLWASRDPEVVKKAFGEWRPRHKTVRLQAMFCKDVHKWLLSESPGLRVSRRRFEIDEAKLNELVDILLLAELQTLLEIIEEGVACADVVWGNALKVTNCTKAEHPINTIGFYLRAMQKLKSNAPVPSTSNDLAIRRVDNTAASFRDFLILSCTYWESLARWEVVQQSRRSGGDLCYSETTDLSPLFESDNHEAAKSSRPWGSLGEPYFGIECRLSKVSLAQALKTQWTLWADCPHPIFTDFSWKMSASYFRAQCHQPRSLRDERANLNEFVKMQLIQSRSLNNDKDHSSEHHMDPDRWDWQAIERILTASVIMHTQPESLLPEVWHLILRLVSLAVPFQRSSFLTDVPRVCCTNSDLIFCSRVLACTSLTMHTLLTWYSCLVEVDVSKLGPREAQVCRLVTSLTQAIDRETRLCAMETIPGRAESMFIRLADRLLEVFGNEAICTYQKPLIDSLLTSLDRLAVKVPYMSNGSQRMFYNLLDPTSSRSHLDIATKIASRLSSRPAMTFVTYWSSARLRRGMASAVTARSDDLLPDSTQAWMAVLLDLRQRAMASSPELTVSAPLESYALIGIIEREVSRLSLDSNPPSLAVLPTQKLSGNLLTFERLWNDRDVSPAALRPFLLSRLDEFDPIEARRVIEEWLEDFPSDDSPGILKAESFSRCVELCSEKLNSEDDLLPCVVMMAHCGHTAIDTNDFQIDVNVNLPANRRKLPDMISFRPRTSIFASPVLGLEQLIDVSPHNMSHLLRLEIGSSFRAFVSINHRKVSFPPSFVRDLVSHCHRHFGDEVGDWFFPFAGISEDLLVECSVPQNAHRSVSYLLRWLLRKDFNHEDPDQTAYKPGANRSATTTRQVCWYQGVGFVDSVDLSLFDLEDEIRIAVGVEAGCHSIRPPNYNNDDCFWIDLFGFTSAKPVFYRTHVKTILNGLKSAPKRHSRIRAVERTSAFPFQLYFSGSHLIGITHLLWSFLVQDSREWQRLRTRRRKLERQMGLLGRERQAGDILTKYRNYLGHLQRMRARDETESSLSECHLRSLSPQGDGSLLRRLAQSKLGQCIITDGLRSILESPDLLKSLVVVRRLVGAAVELGGSWLAEERAIEILGVKMMPIRDPSLDVACLLSFLFLAEPPVLSMWQFLDDQLPSCRIDRTPPKLMYTAKGTILRLLSSAGSNEDFQSCESGSTTPSPRDSVSIPDLRASTWLMGLRLPARKLSEISPQRYHSWHSILFNDDHFKVVQIVCQMANVVLLKTKNPATKLQLILEEQPELFLSSELLWRIEMILEAHQFTPEARRLLYRILYSPKRGSSLCIPERLLVYDVLDLCHQDLSLGE